MRAIRRVHGITVGLALTAGCLQPNAHAQQWIQQFGTSAYDAAVALAPDSAGGAFVTGYTLGDLAGPNNGLDDAFLARYDSAGTQLWIRQFGTSALDRPEALAPDGAGGVMIVGVTEGGLAGTSLGFEDAFLARYDGAGNRLWVLQFGTSSFDHAAAVATDNAGGTYVTGYTGGDYPGPAFGLGDAFLARFDASGIQLWARQIGTDQEDAGMSIAPDGVGGVLVGGVTRGDLAAANAGGWDGFIARYNSAGNQLWIRQFGSDQHEGAFALATDNAGGAFVAGNTDGSLGGPTAGATDAFVARYDGAGAQLWIRQFGTSAWDEAAALAPDGAGGVLLAGGTEGSLGGPNAGFEDPYLTRFDAAGNRLWIRQFGEPTSQWANAVASDGTGGALIAGETYGSLLGAPAFGDYDAFLAQFPGALCPCACDFDTTTGVGVCDIVDFVTFAGLFAGGDPCACDLDTSSGPGVCDIVDFVTFAGQFAGGCP